MKRFLPRFFSILFHPLLTVFYAVLLIFYSGYYHWVLDPQMFYALLSIFFLLTFVLPLIIIPFLYYQQLIPDLLLKNSESRFPAYLSVAILYLVSSFLIYKFSFPLLIKNIMIISTAIVVIITITNKIYHISTHAISVGVLTGLVLFMGIKYNIAFHTEIMILFLVSGVVSSSRLALGYHKPHEVYTGFIGGFVIMLAGMFLLT
ncbi:MAG: hypothetical protein ACP5DZ_08930 [Bacteroidales bacterium]